MFVALLSSFVAALGCAAVATRTSLYRADPFGPSSPNSLDDTLSGDSSVRTAPPQEATWQLATFTRIHEAEEFLDRLEVCGYWEPDFYTLGCSSFAVRWR